jgi:hypothetical protein
MSRKNGDPLDREADPTKWPVGLFIHTWDGEKLCYQGQIRSRDKNGVLWVQLFDWLDGSPTVVKPIDPAKTTITYYATNGLMLDALDDYNADRYPQHRGITGRERVKLMRGPA